MPSPFPGMNPYLEDPQIWPSFHSRLADEIASQLNPVIGPKYYADIEIRTVVDEVNIALPSAMRPDADVFEQNPPGTPLEQGSPSATIAIPEAPVRRLVWLQDQIKLYAVRIYVTETSRLVTAIEILSPYNKRPSEGLEEYRRKRSRLLRSSVHLLEIDLLRGGQRLGREVSEPPIASEYVLLVNRAYEEETRLSEIWPVALNEPLPLVPVPLLPPDPDVALNLGAALSAVHERAGYDWRLNYRRPPPPPELRPEMAAWLKQRLAELA